MHRSRIEPILRVSRKKSEGHNLSVGWFTNQAGVMPQVKIGQGENKIVSVKSNDLDHIEN